MSEQEVQKKKTGFARLDREEHQRISRLGGVSAQSNGNAYRFTTETAKIASEKSKNKGYRFTSETGKAAALKKKEKEQEQ